MTGGLTVSQRQAHYFRRTHAHMGEGLQTFKKPAHIARPPRRFFVSAALSSMAAGIGTPSGVPVPWFRFCRPFVSRHPISLQTDRDGFQTNQESEMSLSSSGEIRSVSRKTLEKRLRRHLEKVGFSLQKTRPNSPAWRLHGDYAIRDDRGNIHADRINLESRLRAYGLMTDEEVIR